MKKGVALFLIAILCIVPSIMFASAYEGGNQTVTTPQPPGGFMLISHQSKIISSADNDPYNIGKMKVTGRIKNMSDPDKKEIYSMVVEGYDANGKCIEVNSASQVNIAVGMESTLSVYLNLGNKIKSYNVYLVDGEATTSQWDLLTYSSRIVANDHTDPDAQYNAGQLKVQGVVKNGMMEDKQALYTFVVEGYDANGKCIELNSRTHVNTSPGFTSNDTVFLSLGTKIKSIKIYLVDGEATTGEWNVVTTSSRIVAKDQSDPNSKYNAGNLKIQAIVKNGMDGTKQTLYTIVVEGYDANGKCIELNSRTHVNTSPGFTGVDTLFLSLGSKVKASKIRLFDGDANSEKIILLSVANHIIQKDEVKASDSSNVGKMRVTSVIKNEFNATKNFKFSVEGYDQKGKLIESQSASCFVSSGFSTQSSLYFKSGASIKKLKYFVLEGGKKVELKM